MEHRLLYLSRRDVGATGVSIGEMIELLARAFGEKGEGRVEMPPKPGVHPGGGDNFIHAMPAYIPRMGSVGMKWVSGFPGNGSRGLPYITGLLILNDVETGLPRCLMDCTWLTAMRTAAASALSARYLARADAHTLEILGCGVQGRSHVEALRVELPSLRQVRAFDIEGDAARRFAAEVRARHDLDCVPVASPQDAVCGWDVIVTAGPILRHPHGTVVNGWVGEGAFASAVDFDSYWSRAALDEFDKIMTDDMDQFRHFQEVGYFQDVPQLHADLGELAAGRRPGREHAHERTMAMNLGLALDDMAVAPEIYRRAVDQGVGTWLEL